MLVTKAALSAAATICIDGNSAVQVNEDSSVYAVNKKCFLALSPTVERQFRAVPLEDKDWRERVVVLPADGAAQVVREIPRDKTFSGLLECAALRGSETEEGRVVVTTTDGKRHKVLRIGGSNRKVSSGRVLKRALACADGGAARIGVCLNRKRLILLLEAIDRGFVDSSGGYAPVWLYVSQEGDLVVRAEDGKTQIRAIGWMQAYRDTDRDGADEVQLRPSRWEQERVSEEETTDQLQQPQQQPRLLLKKRKES